MQRRVSRPRRPVDPGSWMVHAQSKEQEAPVQPPAGRGGAGAAAALASLPFSFSLGPHMLAGTAHPGREASGFFLGRKARGEKETQRRCPGTVAHSRCPTAIGGAALLPLQASAPPRSASRQGPTRPCTCTAVFSGPGRRRVAYFLSGTRARASLEKGNGMCRSDVVKDAGHLREVGHLRGAICSRNLSQGFWGTGSLLLPAEPSSSCLWSHLSYSRHVEVENGSVGASRDPWLPPRPRRRGLLRQEGSGCPRPPLEVALTLPQGASTGSLAGRLSPCPAAVRGGQNKKGGEGWGSSPAGDRDPPVPCISLLSAPSPRWGDTRPLPQEYSPL